MKTSLFLIALLAVISMSCSQSSSPSPAVSLYHGDMTGRVLPLDVNGDTLWSMLAGTTVSLGATSFITTTDSAGHWTLKDVPAADYSIYFAKNGFYTFAFGIGFNEAGDDLTPDNVIVRLPTDSMFLEYAAIRDGRFYGQGHREIFFGGTISSNKLQTYTMHITLDSASNNDWYEWQGSVMNGEYTGVAKTAFDTYTVGVIALDSLSSGRKIFVRAELLPYSYYPDLSLNVTHDYSNIIEVTVP